MGEIIQFGKKNRDIDNLYLELERLGIPPTNIIGIMIELKEEKMIPLKNGRFIPSGAPILGFNCETNKEQGLIYLEKYSKEFKFLQLLLKDEEVLYFDENGFQTTREILGF